MTPQPYLTTANKNPSTGRFYGNVTYGGTVVAETPINSDQEFKNEGQFDSWAIAEAHAHKVSISPEARHSVEKSFTL